MKTNKSVSLDKLLDWITGNVYDATHIGNLTGQPEWVVGAIPLFGQLAELAGMTDDEMGEAYDWARIRVHGPNVDGGR